MSVTARDVLLEWLRRDMVRERVMLGHGREAQFSIDCMRTALTCTNAVRAAFEKHKAGHVCGIAIGGIPIATALGASSLVMELGGSSVVRLDRSKLEGSRGLNRVTLVDDTIVTGVTAQRAISLLNRLGITVSKLVVLLDRGFQGDLGVPLVSIFKDSDLL